MRVFEFKGIPGMVLLGAILLIGACVALFVPAAFMTALWNAIVHESLNGPEIRLSQGMLLWGVLALGLQLILKPQLQWKVAKEGDDGLLPGRDFPIEVDSKHLSVHWKNWRKQMGKGSKK